MKLPRFSIAWMLFGIALLCLIFGLLQHTLSGRSIPGEIGLWPTLTSYGMASFWIARRRGECSPFLRGFTIAGWASLIAYLALCKWEPWFVMIPIRYYNNQLDVWWMTWTSDFDVQEVHVLSLLIMGILLSIPQFMMAIFGGLIARDIWWNRWNTTSS